MSKRLRRFSDKTIGHTVDTVADYVDIFSQLVAEYLNQRYKVEKKVEDIRRATKAALYSLKREFIKSIVETLFLVSGLLAVVLGGILFLSRFAPLDMILLVYGLLITIGVLLKVKISL